MHDWPKARSLVTSRCKCFYEQEFYRAQRVESDPKINFSFLLSKASTYKSSRKILAVRKKNYVRWSSRPCVSERSGFSKFCRSWFSEGLSPVCSAFIGKWQDSLWDGIHISSHEFFIHQPSTSLLSRKIPVEFPLRLLVLFVSECCPIKSNACVLTQFKTKLSKYCLTKWQP